MLVFLTIAIILDLLFLGLLIYTVRRAKSGKETNVREYYAFKCIALLIGFAGDTIALVMAPYSLWDFLADLLQFEMEEPLSVAIVSRILAFLIFCICMRMVLRTYAQWTGPVSRRQYRQNVIEMEESNIWSDFFAVASLLFEKNYDLKAYQIFSDSTDCHENYITNEPAWHIEFAKIYTLMSNQACIDVTNDWHAQQHCFISSYSGIHKIAVLCSNEVPSDDDVMAYLDYIRQMHDRFFHIIVAVKIGDQEDYNRTFGGVQVEYIFKQNALDKIVDFSEYYRAIEALYGRPLMDTSYRIEDVYVEPYCKIENSGQKLQLNPYVSAWLKESGNKQLALLGDFGQGKTLFSIQLTYQMIKDRTGRIPILIPLRNKSPRNSTPAEILSYFAVQYGINVEALLLLNSNGRLLLIFDGFDEMDLIGNDDIRKRHFKGLWSLAAPKSKIFITGRPNYFLSQEEMRSALGLQTETKEVPYCEGLFLQPFDREQIMLALRNTKQSIKEGIQHILDLNESLSFMDLISRPSHLFLAALIWEERELEKKYKNLTSASIINEFLQNCFERQSAKGQKNPYFYLSPVEREYFMIGIAVKMYKMGATAITKESFQDTLMDLIDMFPEQLSNNNSVYLNLRNGKSIKNFVQEDTNSLLAIMNDVRACGILVNDYVNNGFAFAHKSFFDLLVAKFYLGKYLRLHDSGMIISDALSNVNAFNPRLKNDYVIRKLLAELISEKICFSSETADEKLKCRKIFKQCRRIIAPFSLWTTPQTLFKTCIREQSISAYPKITRWRRKKEVGRFFLLLFFGGPLTLGLFLIRTVRIMGQLGQEAREYYSKVSMPAHDAATSGASIYNIANNGIPCIAAIAAAMMIYFIGTKAKKASQNKADLILLTWYYACMDNHISKEIVCQHFSGSYSAAFSNYIEGQQSDELQERLKRKRTDEQRTI